MENIIRTPPFHLTPLCYLLISSFCGDKFRSGIHSQANRKTFWGMCKI